MIRKKFQSSIILLQQASQKGILLLLACCIALAMANSRYTEIYHDLIHSNFLNFFGNGISFEKIINDGLMVLFFLMVGLEIKREIFEGKLATKSQRILPVFAAIGGVVGPIIIYCSLNYSNSAALKGWAIPAATDIAFALGMFALLGKNLPSSLRIFLTALAIIDDLIAVVLIALFYSDTLSILYLLSSTAITIILYFFCKAKHSNLITYSIFGLALWYLVLKSGIHPTIAGVILGMLIPIWNENRRFSPLEKLEKLLNPFVLYIILPLFAFINCGVKIDVLSIEILTNTVTLGIILGLFFGKQIGICVSLILMRKMKLYKSKEFTNPQFYSVSILCGIGFTMSLFVGNLAFNNNKELLDAMKIGVIVGSLLSTIVGGIVISQLKPKNHLVK